MKDFLIKLTNKQFDELNEHFPIPNKTTSSVVGNRAEKLIKLYFLKNDIDATFSNPDDGADLLINTTGKTFRIEIKGTSQLSLNMNNIKVTGKRSYDLLRSGLPLYRVTGVFTKIPKVYILDYGTDYTLDAEQRWVARPVKKA